MFGSEQPAPPPSCASDALLMLDRALGYLNSCDAYGLGPAGQAEVLAALERADAARAAARTRIRAAFTASRESEATGDAGAGDHTEASGQAGAGDQTGAGGQAGAGGQGAAGNYAGQFASGGVLDQAAPEPAFAAIADEVTGPDGRCAGASDNALIGVLKFWQRQESRAASRKLAVVAELIRRRPAPGCEGRGPGGMPAVWDKFCGDELAAATTTSGQAAEKTLTLAYDLAARLPGTAKALYDGVIDAYKARIIADATRVLDDAGAAEAEALVLPWIAGQTPGQIRAAIARAVIIIDPEAARKRREQAQRDARVELWREDAGTAALCGYGLPPDEALAADQLISARARELRACGLDGTMDQLRVRAYLDFLLGKDSRERRGAARSEQSHPGQPGGAGCRGGAGTPPGDGSGSGRAQEPHPPGDGSGGGRAQEPHRPASGGPARPGSGGSPDSGLAARMNLTIPLGTLLGLADRPGEAHGLGAIDPDLARTLAEAAARTTGTTWCVTVTDEHGHPTAHGCARPTRPTRGGGTSGASGGDGTSRASGGGNRDGPGAGAAFTPEQDHGPPGSEGRGSDGHGRWRLRTPGPGGRDYTIDIGPLSVTDCDHRDESAGYQPSDRLRHLVEIRDGQCTWPPCRWAATSCDFEHAVPWDQGGRTCACNAGARCRHHHHAKQAAGWRLEQRQPGYHTWTTPSGRSYTTGPTQYPT